jgi:hypothetical protein
MSLALVAGALANKPYNGGEAWVRLSWALGLRRLGFDVHLVEEILPSTCVDTDGHPAAIEDSVNLDYFRQVTASFGLGATLLCGGVSVTGVSVNDLEAYAASCDVLLNISGHLRDMRLLPLPRCRVLIDIDPGYTQAWHAYGHRDALIEGHDVFATIGERIGSNECTIPACGVEWIPTRQPVVLDDWPIVTASPVRGFSSVARWRSPYGAVTVGGTTHPLKHHEFRRIVGLPGLCRHNFELALAIDPDDGADLASLQANGWHVIDAGAAGTPGSFREYVQTSAAELSACQGVYAGTRSGWLSDRTARYLASGRPAVVEDTATVLPTGLGLLTWATLDEALAAVEVVMRDYDTHARAARRLAERFLDSDVVIGELLERCRVTA